MGEILNQLNETKARLLQKKAYLQNATTELTATNQQLTKITLVITKIEQGGWDA